MKNRRTAIGIFLALLLGVGAFFVGMLVGDDPDPTEATSTFYSGVGTVGPDAFSPSFATEQYVGDVVDANGSVGTDDPDLYVGRPPTYGGSGSNACDIEGMIKFFALNPERAAEWAKVQKISVKEIRSFLESLRPVFLKKNVKLTMFGFAAGRAYGYSAVIEAGTAVLIDDEGMPRVRCACGNPLIASNNPDKTTKEENERLSTSTTPEGETTGTTVPDSVTPSSTPEETPTTEVTPTTVTTNEVCPEEARPEPGGRVIVSDWPWEWDGERWVKVGTEESVTELRDIPNYIDPCLPCPEQPASRELAANSPWDPCNPCPPATTYKPGDVLTDENGNLWRYNLNGYYPINPSQSPVNFLQDIPGFGDDCVPCPPPGFADYNTAYVDSTGTRWASQYIPEVGTRWVNEAGEQRTTAELNANNPECLPCPPDALLQVGDRVIDDFGNVWQKRTVGYQSMDGREVTTLDQVPGFENDCVPCPPSRTGDYNLTYIDANNVIWRQEYVPGEGSRWVNDLGEVRTDAELNSANPDCNPCVELKPYDDGTYGEGTEIAINGDTWVYEQERWWQRGTGYSVTTIDSIPGYANECDPCPPQRVYRLGDYMVDENGDTYFNTGASYNNLDLNGAPFDNIQNIPGYRNDCVPCIPETYRRLGVTFVDLNGRRWVSTVNPEVLTSVSVVWKGENGELWSTAELNALNPECNPCPSPADVTLGTRYVDRSGEVWRFDGIEWVSTNGDRAATMSDLPDYDNRCNPCPPDSGIRRDTTGAPRGGSFTIPTNGFVTIERAGEPQVGELAAADVETWVQTDDNCGPQCPSAEPQKDDTYTDDNGTTWVFEPGDDVWRNSSTNETRPTTELPNFSHRCNPCPPVDAQFNENDMRFDSNGQWWRYVDGKWVNQTSGESRTLLSDLPGYSDNGCDLPPCAPTATLQAGDVVIDGNGVRWVVAENGEERVSENGDVVTLNTPLDGCTPCPPARSYLAENNEEIITEPDVCNPCPSSTTFTEATSASGQLVLVPIYGESGPCGDPCYPPTNLRYGDTIRVDGKLWVYTSLGWRYDVDGNTYWAYSLADIPGWASLCNSVETVFSRATSAPSDDNVITITPTTNPRITSTTTAGSGVVSIATTTTTIAQATPAQPADNGSTVDTTTTTTQAPPATTTTLAPVVTPTTAANKKPTITKVSCTGYVPTSNAFVSSKFTLVLDISDADGFISKFSLQATTSTGTANYKPTSINGTTYTYSITKNTANQYGTGVIASATDDKGATGGFIFSANATTCP